MVRLLERFVAMEYIPATSELRWLQRYCRSGRRLPKTSYVNARLKPRVGSEQVVRGAILLNNNDNVFESDHFPCGTDQRCLEGPGREKREGREQRFSWGRTSVGVRYNLQLSIARSNGYRLP